MNWTRPLEYSALAATFLALVAHGGGAPRVCALDRESVISYEVIGQCGSPGRITITKSKASCDVTVTGDAVGLPRQGNNQNSTLLEGPSDSSGQDLICTISTESTELGRKSVRCEGEGDFTCTSYLLEDCHGCQDIHCTVPDCAEDETLSFSSDKACPTCVPCSSCVSQPALPPEPVCDLEVCPALECEANFEEREGSCCSSCEPAVIEEICEEGRAEFASLWEESKDDWLDCTEEAECMIITTSSRCGAHCDILVSGPQLGLQFSELLSQSEEACQHCEQPTYSCDEPTDEVACVEGRCAVVTP